MVIRKIGVGSAAKVFDVVRPVGLIFGAIVAMIALAGAGIGAATSDDPMRSWLGAMFGVGAIVFLPIVYGVMGAIFGALTAAFYNVVAGISGGLSVDVQ